MKAGNGSFENKAKLKYWGTIVATHKWIQEKIKLGNAYYLSIASVV
jgi:hypothetical protein